MTELIELSELIAPRTSGGLLFAPGCVVGDYRGPGASCRMFVIIGIIAVIIAAVAVIIVAGWLAALLACLLAG